MKNNKTLTIIKDTATFVISLGTMVAVGNVIGFATSPSLGFVNKSLTKIGGAALAIMLSDKTSEHFSKQLDKAIKKAKDIFDKIEEESDAEEEE